MHGMIWMMMVGWALSLLLFCYIFTLGHEGKGVMKVVRYSTLMGLFLAFPMSINQYVVYPLTSELAVIWFVTGVISLIIAGAVFAAIYKPSTASSARNWLANGRPFTSAASFNAIVRTVIGAPVRELWGNSSTS